MTTLLESGAKVDDRDEHGTTALMWAAKTNSNPEIVTTLLENGATDKDGQTLLAAVRNPNPEIMTALLENGAKIDDRTFIELVKTGAPEQVRIAISKGAKIDDRSKTGWTPLLYAQSSIRILRSSRFSWRTEQRSVTETKVAGHP